MPPPKRSGRLRRTPPGATGGPSAAGSRRGGKPGSGLAGEDLLEALKLLRVVLLVGVLLDRLADQLDGLRALPAKHADLGDRVEDLGTLGTRSAELDTLAGEDLRLLEVHAVLEGPPRELVELIG